VGAWSLSADERRQSIVVDPDVIQTSLVRLAPPGTHVIRRTCDGGFDSVSSYESA
jgi:hypothetical protein